MNDKNAVEQFETNLRKAVRSLSRGNFDESITEVSNHYQDIFSESLRMGKSEKDAEAFASERIGTIGDIARKIVESPRLKSNGLRLQWLGVAIWFLIVWIQLFAFNGPREVNDLEDRLNQFFSNSGDYIILIGGVIVGLGVFRSRHLSWRSLSLGFAAVMLTFLAVFPLVYGSFAKYERGIKAHMYAMGKLAEFEPAYVKHEKELSEGLSNPSISDDRLKAIMQDVKSDISTGHLRQTAVVPRHKPLGAYPYPTGFQKILPTRPGTIFWDSSNVYDLAKSFWMSSNQLHSAIPAMTKGRQYYFADVRRMLAINKSWPALIGRFAILNSWPFAFGVLLGWALMRIRIYRRDSFRIRRA